MKKSELRQMIREEIQVLNEASWKHIQTGELTINKKVMAQAKKLFPNTTVSKSHVPQVGYVYYFKDKSGENIGMISMNVIKGEKRAQIDVRK